MSKIFDALRKAESEAAGIALPMIARAEGPPPESLPAPSEEAVGEAPSGTESRLVPASDARRNSLLSQARTVPVRAAANAPVLPFDGVHAAAAEQYRIIRTKILQHPARPKMIVVSSAGSGDGKTVTSINIAGALALKSDVNVLLVDADFRRTSVAALLGLPDDPGLAGLLSGSCVLHEAVLRLGDFPNLWIVPAGQAEGHAAELLDSSRWRAACAQFREHFDFVIVDAPPVAAVADYDLVQAVCDGVIAVARPDHTNRTDCLATLASLPKEKLLGVVLNAAADWFLSKTHGYYYYRSEVKK